MKFAGAWVKIGKLIKVKDQLLACVIASFMWMWSKHTGMTERMVFVGKNVLRNDDNFSWRGVCRRFLTNACYTHTECTLCSCCAHVTCSAWLCHWESFLKGVRNETPVNFVQQLANHEQVSSTQYIHTTGVSYLNCGWLTNSFVKLIINKLLTQGRVM